MEIPEALKIISDRDNFNPDDLEFQVALYKIMEELEMTYDNITEQFVRR